MSILTRRASEGADPCPVVDTPPIPALARRVGMSARVHLE